MLLCITRYSENHKYLNLTSASNLSLCESILFHDSDLHQSRQQAGTIQVRRMYGTHALHQEQEVDEGFQHS